MATTQEVEAKWAEYKAAIADREAKQLQAQEDATARDTAVNKAAESYQAYIAALQLEHQLEDEHEALAVTHEPPALPDQPPTE